MKNADGLVKNKNIEIINYYPDHFEELTKAETQTFPTFWDSKAANNPILGAFVVPRMLTDEFKRTAVRMFSPIVAIIIFDVQSSSKIRI